MATGDPFCPDCEMMIPCKCSWPMRDYYRPQIVEPSQENDEKIDWIDPPHYAELDPQPIDVMEAWGLGFHECQMIKYIARAGRKGGPEKRLEDIEKSVWYGQRLIELLRKNPNAR